VTELTLRRRAPGRLVASTSAEAVVAGVALAALGLRQIVHTEITTGYVLAFLLVPLWARAVGRFGGAWVLIVSGLLTAAWGLFLPDLTNPMHAVSGAQRNGAIAVLVGTFLGVGVVLWARTLMPTAYVTLWYGLGMVGGGVLAHSSQHSDNPWKFVWAVPAGLVLLAAAAIRGRRRWELPALLVLMLLSAKFDSRSYLAAFGLTGLLVLWQMRRTGGRRRASWLLNATLLAGLAVTVYFLATDLLVSGYLGKAAQERSIEQIHTSGSLLLGGRPELAATLALLRAHPAGFGAGAVPTNNDILVAKSGMADIGYDPNNGYVERFMFGDHIELHSTFGDLWAAFGIPGLLLTALMAILVVRGLATGIAERNASAAFLFAAVWTLWNVPFSPFYAAEPSLLLTLGLALLARAERGKRGTHDRR
jgi:hypothetical protein